MVKHGPDRNGAGPVKERVMECVLCCMVMEVLKEAVTKNTERQGTSIEKSILSQFGGFDEEW